MNNQFVIASEWGIAPITRVNNHKCEVHSIEGKTVLLCLSEGYNRILPRPFRSAKKLDDGTLAVNAYVMQSNCGRSDRKREYLRLKPELRERHLTAQSDGAKFLYATHLERIEEARERKPSANVVVSQWEW